MWQWWKRWGILALTVAWLVWELVAAFDPSPDTRPLTQVIVEHSPVWVYVPGAIVLAVWLPPHLYRAGRRLIAKVTRDAG